MKKIEFQTKINDTLDLFTDLNNLYYYENDYRGKLKSMYNNALEALQNNEYNEIIQQTFDENGNSLLHLAAYYNNVKFFLMAAKKGINPYLKNNKQLNAFHSKSYDFASDLWKKLDRLFFESKKLSNVNSSESSFLKITTGFHPLFKQTIYEKNIKNNSSSLNIQEITDFLKDAELFSNKNVLLFIKEKFNIKPSEILNFLLNNIDLTIEENSLGLNSFLKACTFNKPTSYDLLLLENWINCSNFEINEEFLNSLLYPATKYNSIHYKPIFNKQTEILIKEQYDINSDLNFYFLNNSTTNNKTSFKKISELYEHFKLMPIYNYYQLNNKILPTLKLKLKSKKI